MMKKLFFAGGIIAATLAGCSNPAAEKQSSASTGRDTFDFCGRLVKMEVVDSAAAGRIVLVDAYDTSEARNVERASVTVKRNGDTLLFKVASGRRTVLINNNDSSEDASVYLYQGYNKDIDQHVVYAGFYEWHHYVLIDGKTGDTTISWGLPVASPDKKYFVTGNSDPAPGYAPSGIQLFEAANPPKAICEKELGWGTEGINWLTNTTVVVRASVFDTSVSNYQRTVYYKMDLR